MVRTVKLKLGKNKKKKNWRPPDCKSMFRPLGLNAYMLLFLPLGFAQNFTPVLRVVTKLGERPGEDTGSPPYIKAKYKFRCAPPFLTYLT